MSPTTLKMKTVASFVSFIFISCLLSQVVTTAQGVNSLHISGTVLDTDGASIDRASVSLIRDRRVVASTQTNAEGKFELVISGGSRTLSIAVSSPGFRPTEV